MRNLTVLLTIILIATSIGCQSNPKFEAYENKVDEEVSMIMKVPHYFIDRFLDLTDIVSVDLGFGDGFLVNAHATKWFQGGVGYRDAVCFGVMPRSFGIWHEDRVEGGLAVLPVFNTYYKNMKREAIWGTTTLFDHDVEYKGVDHMCNGTTHWSDFGINLHLFLIGADINISPFQAFDFFFGFIGMPFIIPVDPVGFGTELDIADDDHRADKARNDSELPYYEYTLDQ